MTVSDTLVFVAGGDDPPTARPLGMRLYQNRPNPFNRTTIFELEFDEPDSKGVRSVSLEIFNIAGQRVRTIARSGLGAGRHRIDWDDADDRGRPLPSGIYLCLLTAGGQKFMKKAVLLR